MRITREFTRALERNDFKVGVHTDPGHPMSAAHLRTVHGREDAHRPLPGSEIDLAEGKPWMVGGEWWSMVVCECGD